MKKILITIILCCIIVTMSGCGNSVENLNKKIDTILSSEEVTQEQIDEVFLKYEKLSDKQKKQIKKYDEIKIYKNADIEKINKINAQIKAINSNTKFNEMVTIKNSVEELSESEQNLINITKLDEAMALNDLEKAAVAACQYIRNSLKSSSSFELQSAKVINDLNGDTNYYLVSISYSGTNSFGGRKDDASLQTINKDFKNPWYGLALLTGKYEEALKCQPYQSSYLLHEDEPTVLDCAKILYFIDEKVN